MSNRPLDGIRVIDLADEKGELTGRMLADFGADVVRVEPPNGSRSRRMPPFDGEDSLYFAHRNYNKRGVTLDLEQHDDRERLESLCARADVLIESFKPGYLASIGLDPGELMDRYPHLIVLSATDFGQTGPYKDWEATCQTVDAIAGFVFKAGTPDKAPLIPPGAMAYDTSAVVATFGALAAIYQRNKTGFGQWLDVSAYEAAAATSDWSLSNHSMARAKLSDQPELRNGSGPVYAIYPCKTGYVRMVILSPRQWHSLREWLGEPDFLQDPKYDSFIGRFEIMDALRFMIEEHFGTMTHEFVAAEGQRRGIVITPVLTPDEVLQNEHFQSRNTFVDVEFAPGKQGPVASGFYEIDGERQGYRHRAPTLGEHNGELQSLWPDARPAPSGERPAPSLPFAGLRVLDFGIGAVGVECGRLFAEYGADVIKIESWTYPDFMRVVMSTTMSASFASSSRSKRGFGVNIKKEQGVEILRELVKTADVICENGSTGAIDGMGVGWDTTHEINPRLVMASSQLLGAHGAWKDWKGYGPSTQPIGGMVHLWNYEGQAEPAGGGAIYPDHLAGRLLATSGVAGLLLREKNGTGNHTAVAQAEAVCNMIGDLLLKTGLEPGGVQPIGNRNLRGAPWGMYPCAGTEQWVAITCRDDEDWGKLKGVLGNPEWAQDSALDTAAGRFSATDLLDEKLGEWTAAKSRKDAVAELQMFGVPAAPMYTGSDQVGDAHLAARDYINWIDQQDLGWMIMEGAGFHASGMGKERIFQAPKLGENTRQICREELGMDDAEIDKLVEAGVLEEPSAEA